MEHAPWGAVVDLLEMDVGLFCELRDAGDDGRLFAEHCCDLAVRVHRVPQELADEGLSAQSRWALAEMRWIQLTPNYGFVNSHVRRGEQAAGGIIGRLAALWFLQERVKYAP